MAWVKIRVPRTSQPQDACGLDWANPIARGVTDLVSPKVTGDLANVNAAILSPTPVGLGYKGNGTSSYFWRPRQGLMTSNLTMLTIVHGSAGGPDKRAFSIGSSASTTPIAALQSSGGASASKASFFVRSAGGQHEIVAAPDVFIDGKTSVLIGVVRNGVAELYVGGVLGASNVTGHNFSSFTMDRLAVCALLRASALSFSTAQVPLAGLWDRALSAEEIVAISANPWQIFEPEEITIWVPGEVGAGGTDHLVTPANSQQINIASTGAITQTHLIGAAHSTQANTGSAGSVSQGSATLVTAANSTQPNSASSASVSQTHLVSAASSSTAHASAAATVSQTHMIGVASSTQANVASGASVSQDGSVLVSAANSSQANAVSAGSVQQTHLIVCAPVSVDNIASASSIVQAHLVGSASSVQGNSCSASSVSDSSVIVVVPGALAHGRPSQLQSVRPSRIQSVRPSRIQSTSRPVR